MSYLSATHFQVPGGIWPDRADDPVWLAHRAALESAWKKGKEYTRLYTRHGSVAHLAPPWSAGPWPDTLCPVQPLWCDYWRGTGSQAEYDHAAELETCSRCRKAFMDSQRCGNPDCPCQARRSSGGDAACPQT